MKKKCLPFAKAIKTTVAVTVLSVCSMVNLAQAGIIDTSNDSFIDQDSQLEWMDFNVTATQSYNDVTGNLNNGGSYEGWRLASYEELNTLSHNAFYDIAYSFIHTNRGVTAIQAASKNISNGLVSESAFEQLFAIMGADYYTTPSGRDTAHGLFEINPGELSYFQFINTREEGAWDIVRLFDSWGSGSLDGHHM